MHRPDVAVVVAASTSTTTLHHHTPPPLVQPLLHLPIPFHLSTTLLTHLQIIESTLREGEQFANAFFGTSDFATFICSDATATSRKPSLTAVGS